VSDDPERINAPGTAKVVDYAYRIIQLLADRADSLTYVVQAVRAPVAGSGTRPYLGSVPDMAGGDVSGQRISDVTPGSPGHKAGLRAGDVIVEFGGKAVTDLQSYSDALSAHKPGDTVTIVVIRGERRMTLTATLGARGG
jgi:S1-C subfamily serine protease